MNEHLVPPKPRVLVEAEPFIPYMKEDDFAPRLKPVLAPYKKRMGFLPNALKLYAYRPEVLLRLCALEPSPLERAERLEQLRALENGVRIHVALARSTAPGVAVDTPADVERVLQALRNEPTMTRSEHAPRA